MHQFIFASNLHDETRRLKGKYVRVDMNADASTVNYLFKYDPNEPTVKTASSANLDDFPLVVDLSYKVVDQRITDYLQEDILLNFAYQGRYMVVYLQDLSVLEALTKLQQSQLQLQSTSQSIQPQLQLQSTSQSTQSQLQLQSTQPQLQLQSTSQSTQPQLQLQSTSYERPSKVPKYDLYESYGSLEVDLLTKTNRFAVLLEKQIGSQFIVSTQELSGGYCEFKGKVDLCIKKINLQNTFLNLVVDEVTKSDGRAQLLAGMLIMASDTAANFLKHGTTLERVVAYGIHMTPQDYLICDFYEMIIDFVCGNTQISKQKNIKTIKAFNYALTKIDNND